MLKKKVISMFLVLVSITALNTSVANAEWKQDNAGWWYSEGNSYPMNSWKFINNKWYYFGFDGYMDTGWIEDIEYDGNYLIKGKTYYYLNTDGTLDSSKTTKTRPDELQKLYNILINFEPGIKNSDCDLYFAGQYNDDKFKLYNDIKDKFNFTIKNSYKFVELSGNGDEIDEINYDENSQKLCILNQGNIAIIDLTQSFDSLSEKGKAIDNIRKWGFYQKNSSSSILDIEEEKDDYLIKIYQYDPTNDSDIKFVKNYRYDKVTGKIK